MYNKQAVNPKEKLKLKMRNPRNNWKYKVEFGVIDNDDCNPILGISAAQQMELLAIKHENICMSNTTNKTEMILTESTIFEQYEDVFTDVGCLKGDYHLYTDSDVKPVIHAPRRVPVSLRSKLKTELDRLENENNIAKVAEPRLKLTQEPYIETVDICGNPMRFNQIQVIWIWVLKLIRTRNPRLKAMNVVPKQVNLIHA